MSFIHPYNFIHLSIYPSIHSFRYLVLSYYLPLNSKKDKKKRHSNLEKTEEPYSMTSVLFNSHLCGLLKAVCQHIIDSCIILPYIKPRDFATMTNVTVLSPLC